MIKKALIFDVDGTLLDLQKAESQAYVRAFDVSFGLTGISDDWDSYPAHTDIALARDILFERWGRPCQDWEIQEIIGAYYRILEQEVYGRGVYPLLIPGVRGLLDLLSRQKDVGLALATGNSAQIARLRMTNAGIWQYFQCGGFAEDGDKKSRILTKAISECQAHWPGLKKNDFLYLGDNPGDIQAAQINGVSFIRISTRNDSVEQPWFKTYSHFGDLDRFIADISDIWNTGGNSRELGG